MLNAAQQRFAEALAEGKNQTEAYAKAFPKSKNPGPDAGRLMSEESPKKPEIEAEVIRIRKRVQELAGGTVLTQLEKRQFLALSVRTPIGFIDENHVLCQSLKRRRIVKPGAVIGGEEGIENSFEEWEVEEIKAVDKIASIKIDNEMDTEMPSQRMEITVDAAKLEFLARIKTREAE